MAGQCRLCKFPDALRQQVNARLLAYYPGGPDTWRRMTDEFAAWIGEPLNNKQLQMHRNKHLVREIVAESGPLEVMRLRDKESLVDRVEVLLARAERIIIQAEGTREPNVALQGLDQARKLVELLARLLGELREGIQIHVHPEWVQMRSVIVEVLGAYPEARGAVLGALQAQTGEPKALGA